MLFRSRPRVRLQRRRCQEPCGNCLTIHTGDAIEIKCGGFQCETAGNHGNKPIGNQTGSDFARFFAARGKKCFETSNGPAIIGNRSTGLAGSLRPEEFEERREVNSLIYSNFVHYRF